MSWPWCFLKAKGQWRRQWWYGKEQMQRPVLTRFPFVLTQSEHTKWLLFFLGTTLIEDELSKFHCRKWKASPGEHHFLLPWPHPPQDWEEAWLFLYSAFSKPEGNIHLGVRCISHLDRNGDAITVRAHLANLPNPSSQGTLLQWWQNGKHDKDLEDGKEKPQELTPSSQLGKEQIL